MPPGAKMTIKDKRGRPRTITARLIAGLLPDEPWHYQATVEPSRSGRRYTGAAGEPLERFLGRVVADLRGQQRWEP